MASSHSSTAGWDTIDSPTVTRLASPPLMPRPRALPQGVCWHSSRPSLWWVGGVGGKLARDRGSPRCVCLQCNHHSSHDAAPETSVNYCCKRFPLSSTPAHAACSPAPSISRNDPHLHSCPPTHPPTPHRPTCPASDPPGGGCPPGGGFSAALALPCTCGGEHAWVKTCGGRAACTGSFQLSNPGPAVQLYSLQHLAGRQQRQQRVALLHARHCIRVLTGADG